nr:MAG TPA: hypothetical protein [Caudoviricetes sp.]
MTFQNHSSIVHNKRYGTRRAAVNGKSGCCRRCLPFIKYF